MKKPLSLQIAVACVLAFGLLLAVPGSVLASCTGRCVLDTSGGGFCLRCVDAGYETGALCGQSGPCGCYFIQCPFTLQSSVDQVATVQEAEDFDLFVKRTQVAETPKIDASCTPEEILFGLPTNR